MPICKKCGESFPNRIKMNGVIKMLSARKYCLACSPWGGHNTQQIHLPRISTNGIQTCIVCGRDYFYDRKKGHTRVKCGSCSVNQRRFKLQQKMISYKGGKCELCGYSKCTAALVFHHKYPQEKSFQISGGHCYSWDRIQKELDKCSLLCANCHAELHNSRLKVL